MLIDYCRINALYEKTTNLIFLLIKRGVKEDEAKEFARLWRLMLLTQLSSAERIRWKSLKRKIYNKIPKLDGYW